MDLDFEKWYVVSLVGTESDVLLSGDETGGYWTPGVFLSDRLDGDRSMTSWVGYWAGIPRNM